MKNIFLWVIFAIAVSSYSEIVTAECENRGYLAAPRDGQTDHVISDVGVNVSDASTNSTFTFGPDGEKFHAALFLFFIIFMVIVSVCTF
jgi:hypothetical protein